MKRWILALLLGVCTSGCLASQIIPQQSVLRSMRTINIAPIESPPLILHPNTDDDRTAIAAMMESTASPTAESARTASGLGASLSRSAAPFILAPIARVRTGASVVGVIGGLAMLLEAASAGKEVPGESAVIEMDHPSETWVPSVEYAKTAVAELQQRGIRNVRMIDGYVKLPITDRSTTWHMEEWLGPIRRWYNSDVSSLDYAAIGSDQVDAVLEVGVMNYEYFSEGLLLQVFVRLIDPHTKQVLGRVRNYEHPKAGPIAPLLQNDAEGMKRVIMETGNRLLATCLLELGLTSK